jgi:hypothetical protein
MCAAAAAVLPAGSAGAASGGGCQLDGSANFSPGLSNSTTTPFTYSFSGALTNCQSSDSTAPTSGTVAAGAQYTRTYTDPLTGVSHTVTYQLLARGTGGCPSSSTSGTGIVTWADGSTTVLSYTTTGALAAVNLSGSVVNSVDIPAVSGLQPGDPDHITITTTRFAGYGSQGALAFQPPDPTACGTTGVTTAGIHGIVGLGSQ